MASDIMGDGPCLTPGRGIDIPGNAKLILKTFSRGEGGDSAVVLRFVLAFGSGVASHALAEWIHRKTAGRVSRIRMDHVEIVPTREGIEKAIKEKAAGICP